MNAKAAGRVRSYRWLPSGPEGILHAFEQVEGALDVIFEPACGTVNGSAPTSIGTDASGRPLCLLCLKRVACGDFCGLP